jgi:hypothetical protein
VKVVGGMYNLGSFLVTGEPGALISIQLPSGPTTLTNSANAGMMTVTNWISDPPQYSNKAIPASGCLSVNIGATLIVGNISDNPIGMYTGNYNITFSYN